MQIITSKMTSINSSKLPAIYNKIDWKKIKNEWLFGTAHTVLDYGCGRYTNHLSDFLNDAGYIPTFYDLNWNPINIKNKYFDIIICSNVLNVIDDDEVVHNIHEWIKNHSQLYFITVYEGDKSLVSRQTKKDCFQRNLPVDRYMFDTECLKNKVICSGLSRPFVK